MDDTVNVIEVCEAFEDSKCDLGYDLDIDRAYPLVDTVERTLVHKLHANADVGIGQERAVKRDDILRMTIMHYLQLAEDLLAHGWLSVDEDDLSKMSACPSTERREQQRHLLRHDSMRRDMLHLLHTPTIPLPKLIQVLQVLVTQVILDLCVQVEVRECIRQCRMVRHALHVRGCVRARRRRRGARCD